MGEDSVLELTALKESVAEESGQLIRGLKKKKKKRRIRRKRRRRRREIRTRIRIRMMMVVKEMTIKLIEMVMIKHFNVTMSSLWKRSTYCIFSYLIVNLSKLRVHHECKCYLCCDKHSRKVLCS